MIDLLKRTFGPSLRVIWENRYVLRRALWIRTRHPRIWQQVKQEVAERS